MLAHSAMLDGLLAQTGEDGISAGTRKSECQQPNQLLKGGYLSGSPVSLLLQLLAVVESCTVVCKGAGSLLLRGLCKSQVQLVA